MERWGGEGERDVSVKLSRKQIPLLFEASYRMMYSMIEVSHKCIIKNVSSIISLQMSLSLVSLMQFTCKHFKRCLHVSVPIDDDDDDDDLTL